MQDRETATRLDEAFDTAVMVAAVADAITRKEEGGDPLESWLAHGPQVMPVALPPPPDISLQDAANRILIDMREQVEALIESARASREQPTPQTKRDAFWRVKAALKHKTVLGIVKRVREIDECNRGEGNALHCWVTYGIWNFKYPPPVPPDVLEATTSAQAWEQMHSVALELLEAIDEEMAAW